MKLGPSRTLQYFLRKYFAKISHAYFLIQFQFSALSVGNLVVYRFITGCTGIQVICLNSSSQRFGKACRSGKSGKPKNSVLVLQYPKSIFPCVDAFGQEIGRVRARGHSPIKKPVYFLFRKKTGSTFHATK